jgi:hypothetical protein
MRRTIIGIVAVACVLGAASAAEAAQGCGIGFHRGPYGYCRPNGGRVVAVPGPAVAVPAPVVAVPAPAVAIPGPVVVGGFYPGRGWWDGRRYWWHRYPWHGGWRYR